MSSTAFDYYKENAATFEAGLKDFLRIPSISALSAHKADVRRAAEFVQDQLRSMGMKNVELIEGKAGQNPLVYAEWLEDPDKPTLLIYGHYDVQPPDPLNEWKSPPFEPDVRNGNIYARGAVDDKGQVFLTLKAVEGFFKTAGKPPINLKFLIEGEEEVGGEHIDAFVHEHPERLKCDAALICDTEMFAPDLPTLTTGLRGLVYGEIEARGARQDLHSGMYGGAAPNPFNALAEIICGLKGKSGRILIPGFYGKVKRPSKKELDAWRRLPFDEARFRDHEIGCSELTGEKRVPVLNRLWARPTLDVHGMPGGFTGEGAKTVIPAVARAKVSMRLVPDMDPQEVVDAFKARVAKLTPRGIQTKVTIFSASPAMVVSTENTYIAKAAEAMEQVFGNKTVYVRSGGSIPVAGLFDQLLKVPVVLAGFGLPDDNIHSPNEKFNLSNFHRGIEAIGRYLSALGQ